MEKYLKGVKGLNGETAIQTHLRATESHLPYATTQSYLPPDTGERAPP